MINTQFLVITLGLLAILTTSLRESDSGYNDWSIQNIGKVSQLSSSPFNGQEETKSTRQHKNLFYLSQKGFFGHLNRKTGQIQLRQSLTDGQNIVQSNENQIIIQTQNNQIIRYNKFTMHRTVDNRAALHNISKINSYVKLQNKIYISNSKSIRDFDTSTKKSQVISTIDIPEGTQVLKVFTALKQQNRALYCLGYQSQQEKVCLYEINMQEFIKTQCFESKLDQNKYVKVFENTNAIYYGDSSSHHYINYKSKQHKIFNSKPTSFSSGGIHFQNGLRFSPNAALEQQKVIVQSNQMQKILHAEIKQGYLMIYQAATKDVVLKINVYNKQTKILRVWVYFLSKSQFEAVVQFQDLELVMYANQNHQFRQLWSRDESLAYVQKVLFMKYQGYADHLNNPYHMKMDDVHYKQLSIIQKIKQLPINFIFRIKTQLSDVITSLTQAYENILKSLTNVQSLQSLIDIKGYLKSKMSQDSQKKYGLQKYIIVITSHGTMFSIDSKTATIMWKKKYDSDLNLVGLIKLKQQYQKQVAIAIGYKYHITYITQIHQNGTITELQQFQTLDKPTVHKISAHSLLIKASNKVHRFDINKQLFGEQKSYNFYSIQQDQRVLGWKIINQQLANTWSIQIPSKQKVLNTISVYRGQPEANLPFVNDKKVLFKNVDFSNFAILTLQEVQQQNENITKNSYRLHLYIVNGLTGTIQFNQYQTGINPNLPINLVFDQHNAIVTYYNTRNRVYEIWSIQSLQAPNQSQLLSKKYEPAIYKQQILFRSKVYGTVIPIKHLFISQSKQALLKRNLIIITRENKIYLLARELISTRRPKTADADANLNSPDAEFVSSKYPPEQYVLPVNTLSFLNYNKKLADLDYVRFSSSDLESTIFLMAYGADIFLTRTAPDKAFDMLADGFNYIQLVAIMIGVTVAAIFFKNKAKEAKLKKNHLD